MTGAVGIVHHRDIPASDSIRSAGLIPPESIETVDKCQPVPIPDKTAMLAAMAAMFQPADVIELRAFHRGKKRTDAGYFDGEHREHLIDAAVRLNVAGAAVYVTLNQIDPQLLGRYCNRIEAYASATVTDANVIRRRWLLIDFDPVRPKDTNASDMQLTAAHQKARECAKTLKAAGWPEPLAGESGNGWHLYYPLDLPNDTASRDLVKGALAGLAARFDDAVVTVDQAVFNAGRITKLFGTVAKKGDHTPLAPWRLSRLVAKPERGATVTKDQLRELHPNTVEAQPVASFAGNSGRRGDFDLSDFLSRLGIPFEQDMHEDRERYKLEHCPFNPEHGKSEAAIFRFSDGRLGFKCQHASCADRRWQDVRVLVDGPKETRRGPPASASYSAKGKPQPDAESATGEDSDGWPEPLPLVATLTPEAYPLDALPDTIRNAVAEVQGFSKAPVSLVAASALASVSLAIQALFDVKRADGLTGPVSLFLLTIADSGERKSTCDSYFTLPHREYEKQQADAAKPGLQTHNADLAAWEAKRAAIINAIRDAAKGSKDTTKSEHELRELEADKPQAPRVPKLLRADETPENLAFILAHQWPSGGIVSSEAGLVFGSHGMGKDSIMRNLTLYNVLWDGGEHSIGRRTSESFTVRGARLTVGLQVQEPTLREFFERSNGLARGTGFLARFLVAWPESTQGFRPFTDPPSSWPMLAAFNQRVSEILNTAVNLDDDGALTPDMLMLSPEAKAAWRAFHDAIEGELRTGGELFDVRDVASKAADNAARMAALFHVFERDTGAIGAESFEAASRIVAWHLNESRRFFGELALPAEMAGAVRLDAWLSDYCRRERTHIVTTRTVQQFGPHGLRQRAAIEEAIRELEESGRARLKLDGRRREIRVNPALVDWDTP